MEIIERKKLSQMSNKCSKPHHNIKHIQLCFDLNPESSAHMMDAAKSNQIKYTLLIPAEKCSATKQHKINTHR